jgi:RNA polymerase sigma-32 factor
MNTSSSSYTSLPVVSPETGLSSYLAQIRKFPILEKEEEYTLATQWIQDGNREAAHKLVTSHLRLSAKIAMGYRGYGLPVAELISEANIGLMQAVKKFDPEKGFRLATYAMWWIRASIQEYILRSWSLVKMGTTAAQKKLFFNLRRVKSKIGAIEDGDLHPDQVTRIADQLDVNEDEVISMNRRMERGGDASLNVQIGGKDSEGDAEWQDWLTDESADQAARYADKEELEQRHELLVQAMSVLNEREQDILSERRLQDVPSTLEDLSSKYGISRERVRQIEVRAFEKLENRMRELAAEKGLIRSVSST